MKKRVLSAALSLCMLLTLLPTAAFAAEGDTTDPGAPPAPVAPAAPETVYAAKLADQSAAPVQALYDENSYNVNATQATEAETGECYTEVAVSVKNLKKHTNANSNEGHWVGFALAAPKGTQNMKYAFGESKDALTLSEASELEANVVENKPGIAFYVDAGSKTLKTWAQVQWLDKDGAILSNTVYHMDLSGVTLAMAEDSAPAIRPAKLHDNAETNAYKDEELYTAGSYKAAITSQGAGGVYNVAITAQQLREHANAPGTKGYWVGFELTAPETATKFKYVSGATIPDDAELNPVETLADGTSNGVAFYFNAQNKATRTITVQWTTDNGTAVGEPATFSVDLSGVTLAMDEDSAPVIRPAKLHDNAETNAYKDEELYTAGSYDAKIISQGAGGVYNVAITAQQLRAHTNNGTPKTKGYWTGFALAAPDGAKQMKYAFAASKDALTLSDPADLEQNVVTVGEENKSGIAFYLDAGSKTPKTWAQVQWLGEGGAVLSNTVYHMDLSGVTLAMDEDSAPVIRPAKLHDNAETNAYKDEELYTAGSYKAAITSQGAGGVYNVAITAQQLREHTNNGTPKKTKGYWVGFDVVAPEGVTKYKYALGATIPDDATANEVETLPENKTGVAFYFKDKTARIITVQWIAESEEATVYKPMTFSVDLSGVAYYQAPSHGGSGSSGGSASTTYTLTFETNGGSAISKVTKNKGTTIDLAQYAPTKSGATFEGWYADKGLTKKITSVKLDANTTVYAKWTEAPVSGLPFGDVKSADWFYNDVKYVYEKGMMAGTAADVFAPNTTTTRAMIVTILYRLEGSPAVTGTSAFVDVPAGQWYTDAVNWAAANQIVKGTSATTFAPNDSITREQMAAILYRYAQYKGYDVTKKADLSGYSDNGQVSAYAKDALAWANAAKLINGVTNTTLASQGNATRAQVSAILHRFCDGVVK